ncbi:hypothetical protein THAOC_25651, partial [Thalassiosira oceanica]
AGALEFTTVYSTSNLPRLLNNARDDGWRVLGAAADVPGGGKESSGVVAPRRAARRESDWDLEGDVSDEDEAAGAAEGTGGGQRHFDLDEVDPSSPTVLVLGSEGRGLRALVARSCTGFVGIPGGGVASSGDGTQSGVDSLNVSVTGGILLWHFVSGRDR